MKLRYTLPALADLSAILDYITAHCITGWHHGMTIYSIREAACWSGFPGGSRQPSDIE